MRASDEIIPTASCPAKEEKNMIAAPQKSAIADRRIRHHGANHELITIRGAIIAAALFVGPFTLFQN
jgi:hypothetical protein